MTLVGTKTLSKKWIEPVKINGELVYVFIVCPNRKDKAMNRAIKKPSMPKHAAKVKKVKAKANKFVGKK